MISFSDFTFNIYIILNSFQILYNSLKDEVRQVKIQREPQTNEACLQAKRIIARNLINLQREIQNKRQNNNILANNRLWLDPNIRQGSKWLINKIQNINIKRRHHNDRAPSFESKGIEGCDARFGG